MVSFMVINYSLIGKRVASKRKQLKLTQSELAEKADLTDKYISKLETSKNAMPSVKTIMKLCVALETTPNYLLFGISDKELDNYAEIANKLKLCNSQQLRQVSKFIDAVISE